MIIAKKETDLEKELKTLNRKNGQFQLFYFLCLVGGILGFMYTKNIVLLIIGIVLAQFVVKWKWNRISKERAVIRSGVEGERATAKALKHLSNEWILFNDLLITYDNKKSQIDHVVVGPQGVFVVESKNWSGSILPSRNTETVRQEKTYKGNVRTSEHYNPVKQVGTHVYRLSHFLKEQGVDIWVNGCVYFSNANANVQLHDNKIPVFSNSKNFLAHLNKDSESQHLDKHTVSEIVNILKKSY